MVTNEIPKKAVSAIHDFSTFSNVWVETGNFRRRLKNRYFNKPLDSKRFCLWLGFKHTLENVVKVDSTSFLSSPPESRNARKLDTTSGHSHC